MWYTPAVADIDELVMKVLGTPNVLGASGQVNLQAAIPALLQHVKEKGVSGLGLGSIPMTDEVVAALERASAGGELGLPQLMGLAAPIVKARKAAAAAPEALTGWTPGDGLQHLQGMLPVKDEILVRALTAVLFENPPAVPQGLKVGDQPPPEFLNTMAAYQARRECAMAFGDVLYRLVAVVLLPKAEGQGAPKVEIIRHEGAMRLRRQLQNQQKVVLEQLTSVLFLEVTLTSEEKRTVMSFGDMLCNAVDEFSRAQS